MFPGKPGYCACQFMILNRGRAQAFLRSGTAYGTWKQEGLWHNDWITIPGRSGTFPALTLLRDGVGHLWVALLHFPIPKKNVKECAPSHFAISRDPALISLVSYYGMKRRIRLMKFPFSKLLLIPNASAPTAYPCVSSSGESREVTRISIPIMRAKIILIFQPVGNENENTPSPGMGFL